MLADEQESYGGLSEKALQGGCEPAEDISLSCTTLSRSLCKP